MEIARFWVHYHCWFFAAAAVCFWFTVSTAASYCCSMPLGHFHGKFRLGNIFPGNKHALRPFSSDNTPSPIVTELISRQHWKSLKTHLQNASPITLLQQLLDSKTDPDLTLRYFEEPSLKGTQSFFVLSFSLIGC